MLNKTEIITLLTDLEDKGINTDEYIRKTLKNDSISLEVLQFINNNRPLDIVNFYEHIRKNYNTKKSKLYKNIVVEELKEPADAITILSVLLLQINLFASKIENNTSFLKHSRAQEISDALSKYYKSFDLIPAIKLLKLIKVDLKVFESID